MTIAIGILTGQMFFGNWACGANSNGRIFPPVRRDKFFVVAGYLANEHGTWSF